MRQTALYYEQKADTAPAEAAAMLQAQAMIAADPLLLERIDELAAAGLLSGQAIAEAALSLGGGQNLEVRDVVELAVGFAAGVQPPTPPNPGHPYVLVAQSLSAADMLDVDPSRVIGILTVEGGPTGHAAILARSLNIKAIFGYAEAVRSKTESWCTSRCPTP